ncbi:MAG: hypothetical protein ACE5EK_05785, partial [Nitrospinales bacterium]
MVKKEQITVMIIALLGIWILSSGITPRAQANETRKNIEKIKKSFGPVLKLKGSARREINAIANLLAPGSKLMAIDATHASGEMCMLETVTKHSMIHFSET